MEKISVEGVVNMLLLFCLLILLIEKSSADSNHQGCKELGLIYEEIGLLKDENRNQNKEIAHLQNENRNQNQAIALLKDENQNKNKEISLLKESLTKSNHHEKTVPNNFRHKQRREFGKMAKASHDEHIAKRPARLLPKQILFGKRKNSTDAIVPKVFFGPPTNCADLTKLGYTLNGFYQVQQRLISDSNSTDNFTQLVTIYCAFKQAGGTFNENKVEKRLGLSSNLKIDNRSYLPNDNIRFHARYPYSDHDVFNKKIVKFNELLVNFGAAFNLTEGAFIAPKSGMYQFFFQGKLRLGKSELENKYVELTIYLYRNDTAVDNVVFDTQLYSFPTTVIRSVERTLKLDKGDKVYVKKGQFVSHADVDRGNGTLYECSFSGSLLNKQ